MNKLAILKMSKKKIIGAVCVIAAFAGGAVVGAQINANASNNAIAVLPIAKGGTNANTAATAATNILGSNFGNYSGTLPIAKGGTGATALSTSISSSSTDSQVPSAKAVYSNAVRTATGSFNVTLNGGSQTDKTITLSGFTSTPVVYAQIASASGSYWSYMVPAVTSISSTSFSVTIYNNGSGTSASIPIRWAAIGK